MNIFDILTEMVNHFGYLGILISTALEYACFPISSELLLPFIGYSVLKGEMHLLLTVIFATLGAIIGCSICFFAGRFGEIFIRTKLCNKFKTLKIGIESSSKYFKKYGKQSVLIARVFPIARTYISFPAGMSKMKYSQFLYYSMIGAFIWNFILISLGYYFGDNWKYIKVFLSEHKIIIYFICFLIIISIFWKILKKKR